MARNHASPQQSRADVRRDRHLARAGYRVLRLPAALVIANLAEAVQAVQAALSPA